MRESEIKAKGDSTDTETALLTGTPHPGPQEPLLTQASRVSPHTTSKQASAHITLSLD